MPRRLLLELSQTAFCGGPCNDRQCETSERRWLKPRSGGRYRMFSWVLSDGTRIEAVNLRVCSFCNDRYKEMENDSNWNHYDGMAVLRKHDIPLDVGRPVAAAAAHPPTPEEDESTGDVNPRGPAAPVNLVTVDDFEDVGEVDVDSDFEVIVVV